MSLGTERRDRVTGFPACDSSTDQLQKIYKCYIVRLEILFNGSQILNYDRTSRDSKIFFYYTNPFHFNRFSKYFSPLNANRSKVLECFAPFPGQRTITSSWKDSRSLGTQNPGPGTQQGFRTGLSPLPTCAPSLDSRKTPVTSIVLQVPFPPGASRTLSNTLRGRAYPESSPGECT